MNKKKHNYNPKTCQRRIVAEFTDNFGNHIALLAHHAFNWGVYKDEKGRITITQMPREKARQEYRRLKRLHHPLMRDIDIIIPNLTLAEQLERESRMYQ